ncbi:Re/Si-specific NAD(P)(+) transhydrogenase subunit alpha [Aliagarivorans taiwanensis]|uniref:Re/Si-specific NAD(P)(+) transhydrogenase subunit alpha n=1 Tax=Aliagarivorans taiwanensis TaxID=561966 RepID=UPI0004240377|nr:Re/Si-specific NAD(P)(+) transhydrogenase subunit alpha [Aliagarivorans taiwanensis]
MQIGIPRESVSGETRVAATPASVQQLIKLGFDVLIEASAGSKASFDDRAYENAGASISADSAAVWGSDVVMRVNAPNDDEIALLKAGSTLISFIWPAQNEELLNKLAERKVNALAMDSVPRISRAQSLDALSSMANIAGYRAVVEAANVFGRFFTGQITAAGKVPPAKVLVIGAGVAGLAAIGAAGSLGAVVRAFDTRPEVKEQINSMGAEFLELDFEEEDSGSGDGYAKVMSKAFIEAEMKLFAEQAKDVDIIITTALIPGKPAPRLITKEMVESMKPGSVVVDLAAATGGNCELTEADQLVTTDNDVKIIGYTDLAGRLAAQSSQLYGTNLVNLLKLLCPAKDGEITIDFEDVVQRGVTVVKEGEITWPAPPIQVAAAPQPKIEAKPEPVAEEPKKASPWRKAAVALGGVAAYAAMTNILPASFMSHLMVLALACVIGYYLIWDVTASLHTPLMSVTNAISGIVILGALLQMGSPSVIVVILAFLATFVATINIAGGFAVTQRMLKMFRK